MKAVAKTTSHMEYDPNDIWIKKGKIYELELLYQFRDEAGAIHYVSFDEFNKYFRPLKEDKPCEA